MVFTVHGAPRYISDPKKICVCLFPLSSQIQRYEGASTIFGPHTLSAYIQRYRGLAKAIAHVTLCCLYSHLWYFDELKWLGWSHE